MISQILAVPDNSNFGEICKLETIDLYKI